MGFERFQTRFSTRTASTLHAARAVSHRGEQRCASVVCLTHTVLLIYRSVRHTDTPMQVQVANMKQRLCGAHTSSAPSRVRQTRLTVSLARRTIALTRRVLCIVLLLLNRSQLCLCPPQLFRRSRSNSVQLPLALRLWLGRRLPPGQWLRTGWKLWICWRLHLGWWRHLGWWLLLGQRMQLG